MRQVFSDRRLYIESILFLFRLKMKYHPEDGGKRKAELKSNIDNRLSAFIKLLKLGKIDATPLDVEGIDKVVKLLDSGMCPFSYCIYFLDNIANVY